MKCNIDFWVYPYGKVWDMLNKKEDEKDVDKISIYTAPEIFGSVPLSSIEGYFVVLHNEAIDIDKRKYKEKFSTFIPQFHIKRDKMSELEEEFGGKFYPFKK